jgi:RHS repeat-associated protein
MAYGLLLATLFLVQVNCLSSTFHKKQEQQKILSWQLGCISQETQTWTAGETSTRSNASYTAPFQYDGVTSGTSTGAGNPTDLRGNSQAFNGDNQITGTGYAYDGDGSPKTYKGNSLHFDPEGRMTAYGTAETNTYTGDGLRASRNAGGVNYFLYDGDTLLAQLNSDGSVNAVMTFGADGLLSQRTLSGSSNSLYYDFDLSGNVSQRWQSVGSVGQSEGFDGFGRRYLATGGDYFTGFTSQWGGYYDSATSGDGGQTGLTLLTHRFYDPATGRFLTRDPMAYDGGINLYAYTQNDPVNRRDPDGTFARNPGPIIGIGTGVGTAIGIGIGIVIFFGSAGPADPTNEWGPGGRPIPVPYDPNADHDAYKAFCDTPVQPGPDFCTTLLKQITHTEKCMEMIEEWDRKYQPGRHESRIQDLKNRLKKLQDKYNHVCCNK